MADETHPTRARRVLRHLMNTATSLVVIAGAGAAVYFGSDLLADRAEAASAVEVADLIPVRVTALELQDGYSIPRRFVGQVEAAASVSLSFELAGRLSTLSVDEGAEVVQGQRLAQLDTALLEAEADRLQATRAATSAQLDFAESRLTRAQALSAEGFASQETLDQALATRDELRNRIAEIDAGLSTVAINIEKSALYAPFNGRVGLRNVDGGETLGAGAPVLTLIETSAPQVRVGLPLSIDTAQLDHAEIVIDGQRYSAHLLQVRPDIDPVTRTRTAIFGVEADQAPIFGQTASLILQSQVDAPGAWLPMDALQEGLGGVWTVLVVDNGVVRSAAVEVLHAEATRAFVRGTFEPDALLIDTGAHRVVPGQQVRIQAEAG